MKLEPVLKSVFDIVPVDINKYNYQYERLPNPETLYKKTIYFDNNKEYSNRMNILYSLIIKKLINKNNKQKTKFNLFKISKVLNETKLTLYFYNIIVNKLILENYNKRKLILTSSIDDIKNLNKYNLDIVASYNKYKSLDNFFKDIHQNISDKIIDGTTNEKLIEFTKKSNKTYNFIYINNILFNYDYIIPTLHITIKLPLIFLIILNALLLLEENGSIYIKIIQGHTFNQPIYIKIFGLLSGLFKTHKIVNYDNLYINIEFHKFIGFNKQYTKELILDLIDICDANKNNVFSLDDIVSCIASNKFYYYINETDLDKIPKHTITRKILYDINNLIIEEKDVKIALKIINELNYIENEYRLRMNYFMELVKYDEFKGKSYYIQETILNMFLVLKLNNLTDNILYTNLFNNEIIDFNKNLRNIINSSFKEEIINRKTLHITRTKKTATAKTLLLTKKSSMVDIDKLCNLDVLYNESKYIKLIKSTINIPQILQSFNKYSYDNEIKELINEYSDLVKQCTILYFNNHNTIENYNKIKKLSSNRNGGSGSGVRNHNILQIKLLDSPTVNNLITFMNEQNIKIREKMKMNGNTNYDTLLFFDINYNNICNYIDWIKKILIPLVILQLINLDENNYKINIITKIKIIKNDLVNTDCSIFPFVNNVLNIYKQCFHKVSLFKPVNVYSDDIEFYIICENAIISSILNNAENIQKTYNNSKPEYLSGSKDYKLLKPYKFLYNMVEWRNKLNIELYRITRCYNNKFDNCILHI